jgi:hypothetical protein
MSKGKTCIKCNQIKPIAEFHKDRTRPDGHRPYCRACRNKKLKTNIKSVNKQLFGKNKRQCIRCDQIKPIKEFNLNSGAKDGISNICKSCQSVYKNQYYKNNRDKIIEYQTKYYNTPQGKRKRWEKQQRELSDPIAKNKINARGAVNDAVRRGKIKRASDLTCDICGNNADEYHHYLGYAQKNWLKVIPVCRSCHNS